MSSEIEIVQGGDGQVINDDPVLHMNSSASPTQNVRTFKQKV